MDTLRSRIPGASQSLPSRRDIFGQAITNEGTPPERLLSPMFRSTAKSDPVLNEMERLGYAPGSIDRNISGNELTPDQYSELSQIAGEQAKRILDKVVASPNWQQVPDEQKLKIIRNIFDHARETARNKLKMQFPELRRKAA